VKATSLMVAQQALTTRWAGGPRLASPSLLPASSGGQQAAGVSGAACMQRGAAQAQGLLEFSSVQFNSDQVRSGRAAAGAVVQCMAQECMSSTS
jgi:hypothetical protein